MTRKTMFRICGATLLGLSCAAHAQYVRPTYQYPPLPDPLNPGVQVADTPMFARPFVGFAAGRERLDDSDQKPAHHRPGNAADPAYDRSRERLQPGDESHEEEHCAELESDHHAGRAR